MPEWFQQAIWYNWSAWTGLSNASRALCCSVLTWHLMTLHERCDQWAERAEHCCNFRAHACWRHAKMMIHYEMNTDVTCVASLRCCFCSRWIYSVLKIDLWGRGMALVLKYYSASYVNGECYQFVSLMDLASSPSSSGCFEDWLTGRQATLRGAVFCNWLKIRDECRSSLIQTDWRARGWADRKGRWRDRDKQREGALSVSREKRSASRWQLLPWDGFPLRVMELGSCLTKSNL